MRHGSSNRRQRSGGGSRGGSSRRGGNQRTQVFDSNGPDVRIRGTAHQVNEKYQALAKDAASAGNIVLSESYLQHAEHYQRVINELSESMQAQSNNKSEKSAPQKQRSEAPKQTAQGDDLALPSSILGGDAKAESSGARTEELATA